MMEQLHIMKNKFIEELGGIKCRSEKYIFRHYFHMYNDIYEETAFLPKDSSWNVRVYYYINNIHSPKICPTCGTEYYTILDHCCVDCARRSPIRAKKVSEKYHNKTDQEKRSIQNKIEKRMMEKYGVKNAFQNDDVISKCRKTKKERYGNENYVNTEKMKETNIERYGVEYYSQLQHHRESVSKKLHTDNANKNRKRVFLDKYGVDSFMKTKDFCKYKNTKDTLQKQIETKRTNNTFNKSKLEEDVYCLLCKSFDNVQRQYKSNKYPFVCDFYVEEYDLYIECNFHWTHGYEPYNKSKDKHQSILKTWFDKSKHSNFYKNAIKTWTERDVQKFDIVITNNLNFCSLYNKEDIKNLLGE